MLRSSAFARVLIGRSASVFPTSRTRIGMQIGWHRRHYHFSASSSSSSSITTDTDNTTSTTATTTTSELQQNLRPSQIVQELNNYVVGQTDAKRAVAIALRNRWRRRQLPEELRKEIVPRNVLLVGPTGCGKTEVARRMAMLNDAPFIKVEATKYTEVGYHGRDVDKIICDLLDISLALTKKKQTEKVRGKAQEIVEEKLLEALVGPNPSKAKEEASDNENDKKNKEDSSSFRSMLEDGQLEDQDILIDIPTQRSSSGVGVGGGGSGDLTYSERGTGTAQVFAITMDGGEPTRSSSKKKKLTISEARKVLLENEIDKLLQEIDIRKEAIAAVEETGIVFIDEIDKICTSSSASGRNTDASAEGVQRDLLPLVEGTTVSTKHGNVRTDYILFVASGAFHAVKPSDMLPELQGRLPVRVELKGLTEDDLYRILTEPIASMIEQQVQLLKTEGVELVFHEEAIREIARVAADLNKSVENIGARRLHTVMERVMEELSFQAAEEDMRGKTVTVDKAVVVERMKDVTMKTDLAKFIL